MRKLAYLSMDKFNSTRVQDVSGTVVPYWNGKNAGTQNVLENRQIFQTCFNKYMSRDRF